MISFFAGWSSTQPSFPSYSSRFPGAYGHSSSYVSQRNHSGYNGPGYSNTYQPSKYGLGSESSLNSTASSNIRNLPSNDSTLKTENGYPDRLYGFRGREFDLEPYRSQSHRGTDYSSDSGRGPASRRTIDYSSDSGMSYRRHGGKSSDFELEIPSPDTSTSRSQSRSQNDDTSVFLSSPTKSNMQVSDYYRYNDNPVIEDGHPGSDHLVKLKKLSKSEPNLEEYRYHENLIERNNHIVEKETEVSPRDGDDSQENNLENGVPELDYGELSVHLSSPPLFQGEIADQTVLQRNNVHAARKKASDLTQWQQNQRSVPIKDHTRLTLKPPSPRTAYDKHVSTESCTFFAHTELYSLFCTGFYVYLIYLC